MYAQCVVTDLWWDIESYPISFIVNNSNPYWRLNTIPLNINVTQSVTFQISAIAWEGSLPQVNILIPWMLVKLLILSQVITLRCPATLLVTSYCTSNLVLSRFWAAYSPPSLGGPSTRISKYKPLHCDYCQAETRTWYLPSTKLKKVK